MIDDQTAGETKSSRQTGNLRSALPETAIIIRNRLFCCQSLVPASARLVLSWFLQTVIVQARKTPRLVRPGIRVFCRTHSGKNL